MTTVTRGDDQPGTGMVTAIGVTEAPGATGSAVVCAGLTYRFGTSTNLWLDFGVVGAATAAGITASSMLLPRLAG